MNDPYVHAAKAKGYRSRAAFKLVELDSKFHFLKKGARVLDLGAAPGGWSQVAAARGAVVVGADVLEMEAIPGVTFFQADLTDPETPAMLQDALGGPADVVLSDMAAPTTGHRETDHIRTTALVEIALEVAEDCLAPGGAFVAKVFQGGATGNLLARIKKSFRDVKHVKPPASRADSVELYLVASGFKEATREQKAPVRGEAFCKTIETLGLRRSVQADRADTGGDIQALVAFDAQRLQGDGFVEAADQHVGADADADGGLRRGTGIIAFQRAFAQVRGGREHAPHQDTTFGVADIHAEFGDRAGVMLAVVIAAIGAMQILGGAKDKAPAAGDIAGQIADPHAMGRRVGGAGAGKNGNRHSGAHHQSKFRHNLTPWE